MRTRDLPERKRHAAYILAAIVGGFFGILLVRFLFPVVVGNGGATAFLALAILLVGLLPLARASWRGWMT